MGSATTTYTWDVGAGLPVVLQAGAFSYVYGLGLLSQTDAAGKQSYFLGDGLISNHCLSAPNGVAERSGWGAFGSARYRAGTLARDLRTLRQHLDAVKEFMAGRGIQYPRRQAD